MDLVVIELRVGIKKKLIKCVDFTSILRCERVHFF